MTPPKTPLTYSHAGVNIAAGNELVNRLKPIARQTQRPGVLGGLGGFGALFELPINKYQNPVLVSGTDGVGTKLKLAIESQNHAGIGIDLVAMCANDIVVSGAEPLFFLDYYATGSLNVALAEIIINSIATGCVAAGMALSGGETAEMPGLYKENDYDLAGFAVGIVEKSAIIDGHAVKPGDCLIALASSGPHANGYSLIRKILEINDINSDTEQLAGKPLIQHLLAPTVIYVKPILNLLEHINIHAMAHITGGGLIENLPRVLPDYTQAVINTTSWAWPAIFNWLQQKGNIVNDEMYRTFNCGIGMVLCVAADKAAIALELLEHHQIKAWRVGTIEISQHKSPAVIFNHHE